MLDAFTASFPDEAIADLRHRLTRTRWPDQLPDTGWELGTDLDYLRDVCAYWAEGFDWKAAQSRLNAWPQVTTVIDGQTIHTIHARADQPDAMPLLVLHGWPGSVGDVQDH